MKPRNIVLIILLILSLISTASAIVYNNFTPIMTSNTAPAPNVTVASSYFGAGYEAFHVFDGLATPDGTHDWISSIGTTGYIQINLSSTHVATRYSLVMTNIARGPRNFALEATIGNNNKTWTTLDTETGKSWTQDTWVDFPISNTQGYDHYKLNITTNNGDGYLAVGEMTIAETVVSPITANFSSSSIQPVASFTDTSTNSSAIIDSYSWNFGDGNVSSSRNPTHTFPHAGFYPVNLTITNTSQSITSTALATITVIPSDQWNATWVYPGYISRKLIIVGGSSSQALSNYPVPINIFRVNGTDSTNNFNLGSNVLSNFNDTKYANIDGTMAPHAIEIKNDTRAVEWVNIKSIPFETSNLTGVWLYYNNTAELSSDDWTNTFPMLGDNFAADKVLNASQWEEYYWGSGPDGYYTLSNSMGLAVAANQSSHYSVRMVSTGQNISDMTSTVINMSVDDLGSSSVREFFSDISNPNNNAEIKAQFADSSGASPVFRNADPSGTNNSYVDFPGGQWTTGFHRLQLDRHGQADWTIDQNSATTNAPYYYTGDVSVYFGGSTSIGTPAVVHIGYIFAYKYVSNLPANYNAVINQTITSFPPTASFTANPTSVLVGNPVTFNDTSTGSPTMWNTSFGDGNWNNQTVSALANTTHTYSTAGNYTVTWYVTNSYGTSSATTTIAVYGAANSQFSVFNTAGTAPFTTYIYDTSTNLTPGPDTYFTSLGDGNTSTSQNFYFTWNKTGTYLVNHSFSNGLSTSWNNKTYITVGGNVTPPVTAPVASFYGSPSLGAEPLQEYFTDVSSNTPTSWLWNFGDGDSTNSTQQNPLHTYSASASLRDMSS